MARAGQELALTSLAAMANALGRSDTLPRSLEIAAEEARRVLHAASVSVSRFDPGTVTVRTVINVGDLGPTEARWPTDEVYTSREAQNLGRVVHDLVTWTADLSDPDCDPFEAQLLRELGKESALGAPIVVDGQLWGEFYATRHAGAEPFREHAAAYVEVLIAILGGAISRSMREESLQLLASRDPLTGLVNRRALDAEAALVFHVPAGSTRSVTAVALDINGLKNVNDTHGHLTGDQFIRWVALALSTAFTAIPGSLVARVGGDEFTVLISESDAAEVVRAVDSLCGRMCRFVSGPAFSAGVATAVLTEGRAPTATELFAAADRALYVAKRERRCSTVLAHDFDSGGQGLVAADIA